MPPLIYDLVKNPLYSALKDKANKLRDVPEGCLRGILLGDAGCSPLRDIFSAQRGRHFSGRDVIWQFLRDSQVDFVSVFVPQQINPWPVLGLFEPVRWHLYTFPRTENFTVRDGARLEAIRRALPPPHRYGYQARQIHELGGFEPHKSHCVGSRWTMGVGTMTTKFSARALHELMAGRIDQGQFLGRVFGDDNWFERALGSGMTITNVSLEAAGTNEDDDYVVVEFGLDPAASPLRGPIAEQGGRPTSKAVTRNSAQRGGYDP